jgi:type I restriction enzyme, S subunit
MRKMMKNSLPQGWEEISLTEQTNFLSTGVPEYSGNKRYYSTGSIQENNLTPEGEFTFGNRPARANRIVEPGDVLQARMKGTDKALLIDYTLKGCLFSTGFIQLRPYADTIIPEYLYFFIKSDQFLTQRDNYSTGSTQEALTDGAAKQIFLPLPPITEQKRIVERLNTLFVKVNNTKVHFDKIPTILKYYRQSVLDAAISGDLTKEWRKRNLNIDTGFNLLEIIEKSRNKRKRTSEVNEQFIQLDLPANWAITNLDSVSDEIVDCPHSTPKWVSSGKICLRTTNFQPNKLNLDEVKYVSEATYEERISRLKPQPGDILYSREGGILGIACLLDIEEDVCLGQRMMMLRVNPNVSNKFVSYYLNSPTIIKHVNNLIGGSAAPHINVRDIKEYPLPVPSYAEQLEIVRRVDELFHFADSIEARYNKAKSWFDKISKAILSKAFRGELVEQDKNDEPASNLLDKIKHEKEILKLKNNRTATRKRIKATMI